MTELRKMIQSLSLYITPLGKMMEYFQEDVDAMQIELMMWKTAGETTHADIKEEQRYAFPGKNIPFHSKNAIFNGTNNSVYYS